MFRLCMTPVTKNNLWQKVACDWSHFSLCEWSYSSTFAVAPLRVLWRDIRTLDWWHWRFLLNLRWTSLSHLTIFLEVLCQLHGNIGFYRFVACNFFAMVTGRPHCILLSGIYQGFASFAWSVDSWPSIIFAKFGWWWLSGEDHIAMMLPARNGRGCFAQPAHICVFVCLSNRSWFMILVNTWHLGYSPCPHLFPGMEVWRKYIAWTNDPRLMAGTEATS